MNDVRMVRDACIFEKDLFTKYCFSPQRKYKLIVENKHMVLLWNFLNYDLYGNEIVNWKPKVPRYFFFQSLLQFYLFLAYITKLRVPTMYDTYTISA